MIVLVTGIQIARFGDGDQPVQMIVRIAGVIRIRVGNAREVAVVVMGPGF